MFNPENINTPENNQFDVGYLRLQPLLYVLGYSESPNDLPHMLWQQALKGESDVFISRAEIDLRKAMQTLLFGTNSNINSFESLAALSLPGTTTALFWVIESLLKQKYQKPNLHNPIHQRNHDARVLFQHLAKLNLDPWYESAVSRIFPDNISADLRFPIGHPIPGYMYRQHPLKTHQHCYYPIHTYFSLLFEERKQTLLKILRALGATKVFLHPVHQKISERSGNIQSGRTEYTEFPENKIDRMAFSEARISAFKPLDYPWLAYEPSWKSVVDIRLMRKVPSIKFEIDVDVMGILRTQIQTTAQLISELTSMLPSREYEDVLSLELLQPMQVEVEFQNS
ncbi:MAG: hypothetical protein F6K42_26020 [Leptolyngbya sp. SIO1D8]|nr:hypothetical protein [Leptolyngbya sp. SIO1D8]